jgi:DMSO reductase anchor subunit
MNPAFSVIFLTTLIGAAQGLFLAMLAGQIYSDTGVLVEADEILFFTYGTVIISIFMGLGLFASFFHLGRPERAWRTATKWKTSWLSREVIVLPAFAMMAILWGVLHYRDFNPIVFSPTDTVHISLTMVVGLMTAGLAMLLYLCTAMIYAAVKFIQEWANPLTVVNYAVLGMASGFTISAALASWLGFASTIYYTNWAIFLTLVGFATRLASLYRNAHIKLKSNAQSAIGVRHPMIRQTSQGAMGGSFNTREFFHHKTEAMIKAIKWFFIITVFVIPVGLLVLGVWQESTTVFILAFVVQYVGLLAERWFFFAQARHPQNIYYAAT